MVVRRGFEPLKAEPPDFKSPWISPGLGLSHHPLKIFGGWRAPSLCTFPRCFLAKTRNGGFAQDCLKHKTGLLKASRSLGFPEFTHFSTRHRYRALLLTVWPRWPLGYLTTEKALRLLYPQEKKHQQSFICITNMNQSIRHFSARLI